MSYSHPHGLLAAYNSLTDKHLAGYFNNTRIRRHLLRSGLITRSGRILSEKEYKLNIMKRDHQKYIRECLAHAIFHKVLDMERNHQLEIKRKLETLARKERIQRFKGEYTRQFIENNMPILSPHPPVGPKTNRGHSVLVDEGHSSPLTLTAPRPYTAPGNMQQPPIRLQPLPNNHAVRTIPKITSESRSKTSLLEKEVPFPVGGKKAMMKFRNSMDKSQRMNPYQLPHINSYMMPNPPPPPPSNGKITREARSETWRNRRFRSTTAPNGLEPLSTRDSGRIHKTSLHSNAAITMIYLGKNVHLSYDDTDFRDEIRVYQQHCGGENLCVYKGKLLEKETFQFISKRHHGFPFSLTFFLNGLQVDRLSSCCEYRHRKGSRLGGKGGYFGFVCVEKASPCYKCIIAMGLDKKTSSQKPRKEKSTEKREELRKGLGKLRKDRENVIPRRNEIEGNKTSVSASFSAQEINTEVGEVRTAMEEMEHKGKPGHDVWEEDQENAFKYEYEEDFEVDEEKQNEKANEEGQADDQMNGISKAPSENEKDNLGPEKDSEILSQKAPDADDTVKDEDDRCSESELEEDKQDVRTASSTSSRSQLYSSNSEDDSTEGHGEAHAEHSTDESDRGSSQELSRNDEPGKPHLPTGDPLEIEIEDEEIMEANVKTKPLLIEKSSENVLEEEMEKGTQGITQNLSEKEEKEKDKRKLWERSTAKVEDKMAGLPGVEEGVGQIVSEALAPDCHCHSDTESGVSRDDEGEKPTRKLVIDTGGAPDRNLVVEERAALSSNKDSQHVAQETSEKKEAMEEDDTPQPADTDTAEEKEDAALREISGVTEAPLREQNPTAEQPALALRETPLGIASGAEAEGDRKSGNEGLKPTGEAAARDSACLSEDEPPKGQDLTQAVIQTDKAASEGEQGSEKAMFTNSTALSSEHLQEAAAPREGVTLEKGEADSKAGSRKPGVDESEEEAPKMLEDTGPMEDRASERLGLSEEAMLGVEEPATERKEVLETETPLSSSTGEAGPSQMEVSVGSPEELCKEDATREEPVAEAKPNGEDDRKEMSLEELDVPRERRKSERPETPLRETGPEREEVTGANALQDEDTSEEQKLKGEERKTLKGVRAKEEMRAPQNKMESDAEDAECMEATELTEDTELLEDSLKERKVTMFEATPGIERSLEKVTALRNKGGDERLNDPRDTEHKGRTELLGQENVAPLEQQKKGHHDREGTVGAPGSEPASKAQALEVTITATGAAEVCPAKDKDSLSGLERRDEGPLQGQEGARTMTTPQEDVPEIEPIMAAKSSEEAMDEDPEGEDKDCTWGTGAMKDTNAEGDRVMGGGAVVTAEDPHQRQGVAETATEKREVLADSMTADGKTVANKAAFFSDVAGEETWHKGEEALGKTTAVATEEIALSREEVPALEEVPVTPTAQAGVGTPPEPKDLEGQAPRIGQDEEDGEEEAAQHAGSVGEADTGSFDVGQESGAAEEFRRGSSPETGSELSRQSLEAVTALPGKPAFSGIPEKQECMEQRESESADVSLNNMKD